MSMKEPSLSRRRRPNSSKKLKLVCSFNGRFQTRHHSGKLCYVGGDTRIISVDRGIGFLKLRSKISELCTNDARSFSIKYRLPGSDPVQADTANLILITSDDDVRCMVDEYDKIDSYGQQTRLWIFVCCDDDGYANVNLPVDCTENRIDYVCGGKGFGVSHFGDCRNNVSQSRDSERHLFGLQFDAVETSHPAIAVAGGRYSDHSLRKGVLKPQLSVKKLAAITGIWNGGREFGGSYEQKYWHPLIDLAPEALVPNRTRTAHLNSEHPHELNFLVCKNGEALSPINQNFEHLVRNEKTAVCGNRPNQYLLRPSGCNAGGMNQGISNTSNELAQFPQFSLNSKQNLKNMDTVLWTDFNRENIPCPANYDRGKTALLPPSRPKEMAARDRTADLLGGIRSHKFGAYDTRSHRMCLHQLRDHQSNLPDMGCNRNLRLDGRPWSGRCCPGLRPNSNITKQGQSMRSYHPNISKPRSGTYTNTLQGLMRMMDSSLNSHSSSRGLQHINGNKIDHRIIETEHGSPNVKESMCAYHGAYSGMGNLPLLSYDAVENTLKDRLVIDSAKGMHEVPEQNSYLNFHGVLTNCESGCHDSEQPDPRKVDHVSAFPNYPGYQKVTELKGNSKLSDREAGNVSLSTNYDGACTLEAGAASTVDTHFEGAGTLPGEVASPFDLSLGYLSLSSTNEVEPLLRSSPVYPHASGTPFKSQSKHLDLLERQSGPEAYKSNGMVSDPLTGPAAKLGNDYMHKELELEVSSALNIDEKVCVKQSHKGSKVIGESCTDLAAFCSLLATRELQTIKNSDLEYIKELGSGTYGTVSYGKWKGSDVAIKRIKPICFTENKFVKDRLVEDFWKEAHILGQLHHPNIVAFYGVVTDGPVTNLATVTEYMVNGSLKQVLQKKDRTIDHRKRLIIAMDAAFGMEYLHGKNIVHFDLKSHNFLMNMRDPQRPICKIGDLGLSKVKQRTLISGGLRGTIPWMAPELLDSRNNLVTEKIDVYSFGIVMWELLTGEEPYGKLSSEEIIAGIIKGNLRPEIPTCDPAWRSLMERCWSSDPGSRPDFSEIARELRVMSAAMNIK